MPFHTTFKTVKGVISAPQPEAVEAGADVLCRPLWSRGRRAAARRRCRAWCMACTFRVEMTQSSRFGFESGMEMVHGEG